MNSVTKCSIEEQGCILSSSHLLNLIIRKLIEIQKAKHQFKYVLIEFVNNTTTTFYIYNI